MATATNQAFMDYYKVRLILSHRGRRYVLIYQEQNILPAGEWDAFIASLRTELPLTFRVTGSRA